MEAPPQFLTEQLTRRAHYAHHSTTSTPPRLSDLATALLWVARKVQVSDSGSAAVNLNCLLFFHKSRHKQKSFLQS